MLTKVQESCQWDLRNLVLDLDVKTAENAIMQAELAVGDDLLLSTPLPAFDSPGLGSGLKPAIILVALLLDESPRLLQIHLMYDTLHKQSGVSKGCLAMSLVATHT